MLFLRLAHPSAHLTLTTREAPAIRDLSLALGVSKLSAGVSTAPGGYVSFEIMRQAPERVGLLALLDTKARLDTPEQTSKRRGLIELAQKGNFKGVTPQLLQMFVHESRHQDPVAEEVMAMAERVGRDSFLTQQQAIMSRPDSLPTLPTIACPTLVLCGRQDQATPLECHEEIAEGIPDAKLVVIEVCGHLAPVERPHEVNAALREWLNRW